MELTKKINFRESKYMITALIYFPLLFTGYFVIDMFGTKKEIGRASCRERV